MQRDINFFSNYLIKNQDQRNRSLYQYIYYGVIGAFIGGTFAFNQFQTLQLKGNISDLKDELASPSVTEKIDESDWAYQMLEVLNQYNREITSLVDNIQSRDLITSTLLDQLSSTLPSDITLGSLNITSTSITMQATSETRIAIAELQHNLKQLPFISDVYIGAISSEVPYTISITCTVTGGEDYAN
ncbi:MAG: PilN domain-containing protein [Turicibacter sp.]|nr:PilN domain-containing protein [Turicibacter sp.]